MECRDPREKGAGERVTVPLALLSAGDKDLRAAFDHVMEDLADALDVYERMATPRSDSHRGREETQRARSFSLLKIEVEAGIGVERAVREAMGPCSLSGLPLYGCAIAAGRPARPAVDLLIAAIRSGCSVSDLMGGPASGILVARCPVPAPLYPLVVRLHGDGGARRRV